MKLAMIQMSMTSDMKTNLAKTRRYLDEAREADLVFFPEIQLSPFFPQYPCQNVDQYIVSENDAIIQELCDKAREHHYYVSPNLYLRQHDHLYDASLMIDPEGHLIDIAKMVQIARFPQFYEQDYYTPSDDGFKVFATPFGKIGIVICYDRHLPESIRTSTLKGADLIIIPTANTKAEDLTMFEWEIKVQAMQNQVFIAMCNRVGIEGEMNFAGESLVVDPTGRTLLKADDQEHVLFIDLDLSASDRRQKEVPYLATRRPEMYEW